MRRFLFWIFVLFIVGVSSMFGLRALFAEPAPEVIVTLPEGLNRVTIGETIGKELKWKESDVAAFASTHAQMQWAEYNKIFLDILTTELKWSQEEQEIFLTNSTKYFTAKGLDFYSSIYFPDRYTFTPTMSMAEIAGLLISRTKEVQGIDAKAFVRSRLSDKDIEIIRKFVQNEYELLPDLTLLPPSDLKISKVDGKVLMVFTTVYYNMGKGPLELIADPKTAGVKRDIERDVLQRIYRPDGSYRDRLAGTFLWHQAHLHYHFADFVVYDLEPVSVTGTVPDLSGVLTKNTFCIRDISRIDLELPYAAEKAGYGICGKEKQGISVGWGDAYFYNYPDQSLDISDLPSGIYRLTFYSNPEDRFDEISKDNNNSSALIDIDIKNLKIKVLESFPANNPKFEHVYPVQENCSACRL